MDSLKLDRFSDYFTHNKDRLYHPKNDLDFSPSNLIFIDPKARASKRIKSGNSRLRKPKKKVEFGPQLKSQKEHLKIDGTYADRVYSDAFIVYERRGKLLDDDILYLQQDIPSTTVNRVNMCRIVDRNSGDNKKRSLNISKSYPYRKSQNMEYKSEF